MAKGKQNVQIPRKYNIFVSGSTLCAPVANGLKIFISVRNVIIPGSKRIPFAQPKEKMFCVFTKEKSASG